MAKYKFEEIAYISTEKKKPTPADKNTYLGLEHLDSECLQVTRFGSDVAPVGEKLVMRQGDVLFGKRRAYQRKVAIAPFDGIFSAHGMVLRPNTNVIIKELFPFFISSKQFLDEAIKISVGSLSPTINGRDLKMLEFDIPPLEEQAKLAEVLWAFEKTKATYKTLLTSTEDLVQAQFIEMFGDPVLQCNKWEKMTLKQACLKLTDGTHFSPENFNLGDYKYITAKNIKKDGFDFTNLTYVSAKIHQQIYERCNPERGDILYIKDGVTTGIAMINTLDEEFTLLSSVALLKFNRAILNEYYLREILNSPNMYVHIRNNMGGCAITRLTIDKLNKVVIPVPPLDLQCRFASLIKSIDHSKLTIQQSLTALDQARNALMEKTFR